MERTETSPPPQGAIPTNEQPIPTYNQTNISTEPTPSTSTPTSRYERIPLTTNVIPTASYEEIECPRNRTLTLKSTPEAVSVDQLMALFETLGIITQVQCIQKIIVDETTKYEITIKEGHEVKDFGLQIFKEEITVNGNHLVMTTTRKLKDIIRNPIIRVLIFEAPYELQDRYILQKLSPYGMLQSNNVYSHKYKGTDIYNGVRSVNFTRLTKPIPTVPFVRGNRIKIKYDSQDWTPICGICKVRGHFRNDCPRLRDLHTDVQNLPTEEVKGMLYVQEEKMKQKATEHELARINEERRKKKEEDDERRRQLYEQRKRTEEPTTPDDNEGFVKVGDTPKRRKKADKKKKKTPYQTPISSPIHTDEDLPRSDSTNTIHAESSSLETDNELDAENERMDEGNPITDSYPPCGQQTTGHKHDTFWGESQGRSWAEMIDKDNHPPEDVALPDDDGHDVD